MTTPRITTVIPTYRRPQLLRRAMDSVLGQDCDGLEVCVYDNASGDETASVVAEYAQRDPRVRYHAQRQNLGLTKNLASALQRVETPYFTVLSDDDIVLPGLYRNATRILDDQPDAAFVSTRVIHVDGDSRVLRATDLSWVRAGLQLPSDGLMALLRYGGPIWNGTIFRTSMVNEIGGFDPETGVVGDWDLLLRLASRFPFLVEPTPGAVFFHHKQSISTQVRLDGTWPGWLKLMENVDSGALPDDVRREARQILTKQLISRLYGVGTGASRRGNFDDARKAASLLDFEYGQRRKAATVRALVFTFSHFPFLAKLTPWIGGWRFSHLTTGWRRVPMTLSSYLSQQASTPRSAST